MFLAGFWKGFLDVSGTGLRGLNRRFVAESYPQNPRPLK